MIRKKKKRVAVPVKNPYKELGLPFEGRRMTIRPEDIEDPLECTDRSELFDFNESALSGSSHVGSETDLLRAKSETRSCVTCSGQRRQEKKHNSISTKSHTVNDTDTHDEEMVLAQQYAPKESTHKDNTSKCRHSTDDYSKLLSNQNLRYWKSGPNTIYKVARRNSNETEVYKVHACPRFSSRSRHDRGDQSGLEENGNKDTEDMNVHRVGGSETCTTTDGADEYNLNDDSDHQTFHTIEQHPNSSYCKEESDADTTTGDINELEANDGRRNRDEESDSRKTSSRQITLNVTPEGCGTTYHIRRVNQCMGDSGSEYACVIQVDCKSHDEHSVNANETLSKVQPCPKRRRGELIRVRYSMQQNHSPANINQKINSDRLSNDMESNDIPCTPYRCPDDSCKRNLDGDKQRSSRQTTTAKCKVFGRLIDHLERQEQQQSALQGKLPTYVGSEGLVDFGGKSNDKREMAKMHCRKKHVNDRQLSKQQNEIVDESPTCLSEENVLGNTNEAVNESLIEDNDCTCIRTQGKENKRFTKVKAAQLAANLQVSSNLNKSRNFAGRSRETKSTHVQPVTQGEDVSCHVWQGKEPGVSKAEPFSVGAELNDYGSDSQSTTRITLQNQPLVKSQNEKIITDHTKCCSCGNKDDLVNRSRFVKGQMRSEREDLCCDKLHLRNTRAAGRTSKTGSDETNNSGRKSGENNLPLFSAPKVKNSEKVIPEQSRICSAASSKRSRSLTIRKSPSLHSAKRASSPPRNYTWNRPPQSSYSSDILHTGTEVSPERVGNDRQETNSPLLSEQLRQQSPEMNLALQNANQSNRMVNSNGRDVNYSYASATRWGQPPRLKSKKPKVDETGESTLSQLSKILEEARANSVAACGHGVPGTDDTCVNASFMGEYLRCLWRHQMMCDTKVTVGDEKFLVHKLVLAAFSSVFCPSTPKPPPTVSFEIPNSTPEAVSQIFSYMYTSNMTLTDEILEPVIVAAIFMGIKEIIDVVKDILTHPTLENIKLYNDIIKRLGLDISLLDQEMVYRESFLEMKNNSAFLEISLEELESVLMDPEVMVTDEVETIEVIISWIEYNYLQRICSLESLLRHVSFEVISPDKLAAYAEKYSHIFDTPAGNSFLCKAFKYHALNCGTKLNEPDTFTDHELTDHEFTEHKDGFGTQPLNQNKDQRAEAQNHIQNKDMRAEMQTRNYNKDMRKDIQANNQNKDMHTDTDRTEIIQEVSPESARAVIKTSIWGDDGRKGRVSVFRNTIHGGHGEMSPPAPRRDGANQNSPDDQSSTRSAMIGPMSRRLSWRLTKHRATDTSQSPKSGSFTSSLNSERRDTVTTVRRKSVVNKPQPVIPKPRGSWAIIQHHDEEHEHPSIFEGRMSPDPNEQKTSQTSSEQPIHRTTRVSFQDCTKTRRQNETHIAKPSQRNYPHYQKTRDASRNNNASIEGMRVTQDMSNNPQSSVQNSSSNDIILKPASSGYLRNRLSASLETNGSPARHVHCSEESNTDKLTIPVPTRRCMGSLGEISKGCINRNYNNECVLDNSIISLLSTNREEHADNPLPSALHGETLFSFENQNNTRRFSYVDSNSLQHTDDLLYLSDNSKNANDRPFRNDNMRQSSLHNGWILNQSVENEESLKILGHDAEASAFRVYKPVVEGSVLKDSS